MSDKKKDKFHRFTPEEINSLPGSEVKSKRTRSSKTYALGNGLYQAVIYPEAVHYRNEKGEWEDIDHSLTRESGVLCDHSGDLSVQLAPGGGVTLQRGEHTLSWEIVGAAAVKAATENAKPIYPRHHEEHRINNRVTYTDIFPNVDFVCDLKPNQFKDTLIFKEPSALRPVEFLVHSNGLVLRQSPSGAVVAMCGDSTIFRLPAPCVVDENGTPAPDSAHAELIKISENEWRLVYEVAADFAAAAAYPIHLDPVVETEQTAAAMSMAYTSSKKPTTNYPATGYSTNIAYSDYTYGKACTFLRFEQDALPEIDSSYYVTAATLTMRTAYACTSTYVYLKEVETAWNQSTITHNNCPAVSAEALECYIAPSSAGSYLYFNITNTVRKWYNGENYGVMLETLAGNLVQLGAAGATYHKPYVTINYVSLAGLESYLTHDSIGCGRAGTAHVDLFNGNLVFSHQETAMNGNLMPVSISRYYNSCYHDVNPFGAGYGWKLSCQQTLHKETIGSTTYYVYMDGDGTRHHFKQESGEWHDLSGLNLTLTISGSTATIKDKGDNTMVFALPTAEFAGNYANVKMLQKVSDACGNTATFTHNTSRVLTKAEDGAGRSTLGNVSSGSITKLTAPGMNAVSYTYTSGKLTKITHEDGAATTYAYDTKGLLVSVSNHDGTSMQIEYIDCAPYRVKQITLLANGKPYAGRKFIYGNCCTEVKELYPVSENVLGENDNQSLFYHFNDAGNLVSVNDKLGYGCFAGYSDDMPLNHPKFVSRMQRAVNNYLRNHHFITVNDDWTADLLDGTGECGYNSDQCYIGGRSYRLKKTSTTGRVSTYQSVSLTKGSSYTFSCQYKTSGSAKAQLQVEWQNSSGTTESEVSPAFASTDGWSRTHVSFTLPDDAASAEVVVRIMAAGGAGTVWADAAQLEDGLIPNRYNLLQNGNFYMNTSGRPEYWLLSEDTESTDGVTTSIAPGRPSELTGYVAHLTGEAGVMKYIDQTVPCIGNEGDTYVAGGWSWSHCRPRNDDTNSIYEMQILARPYVDSGVAQFRTVGRVRWSEEWSGWQFAAIPVTIPFRYTDMYVKLLYQNNLNEVQFSNLFLYKEEFGKTYEYDDNANVTNVRNLASLKTNNEYDDFDNLVSHCRPGRDEPYTYTWGTTDAQKKQHLLRTSTDPFNVTRKTTYDVDSDSTGAGLPVESTVQNSAATLKIVSQTGYTEDKNYVLTQTDARGKTVTTTTDANTGRVTSVKDPKGQVVSYTYDTLGRVTDVASTASSKTYRNRYTYTGDNLTSVAHNTTVDSTCDVVYNFEYDDQNRRTHVKIGNQLLSQNVYNETNGDPLYGTLTRTVFGNGGEVRNSYDGFKRIVGVQFDNDTADRYKYEYGANGQVARVTNTELTRTAISEYDSKARPMRITHMNGANHLYTGEVAYNDYGDLAAFREEVGTNRDVYTTSIDYNIDRPTTLTFGSSDNTVAYTYDTLGRISKRAMKVGTTTTNSTYTYAAGGHGTGSTTGLISKITHTNSGLTHTYTYDANGNITRVVQGSKYTYYVYDALGQLVRVNDQNDTTSGSDGTTWRYAYDRGGNILSKKRFAYSTGAIDSTVTPLETISYTYDSTWKDQLKSYNGAPIKYDDIGNPTQYGADNDADKITYEWEKGRQLARMDKGEDYIVYKYNENGLRVRKAYVKSGEYPVVTNYTLHGKNVVHMTQGSNSLHFYYDASGKPAMVDFNGVTYGYVHNLQGDIVAIVNSSGAVVVSYTYDAWGKPLSKTGTLASTLGTLNPFRYRGYVYDEETGLYYLRSRYYNPTCCRFINADVIYNGNIFAYCNNTPTTRVDKNGYEPTACFFDDMGVGNIMATQTSGFGYFTSGWNTYTYAGVMQGASDDGNRANKIAAAQGKIDSFVRSIFEGISLVVGGVLSSATQAVVWLVRHSVVPLLSLAYTKLASVMVKIASSVPIIGVPVVSLLSVLGYGAVLSLGDVLQRGVNSLLFGDEFVMPSEAELIDMVKNNIITDTVGGFIGKLSDGATLAWVIITTFTDVLWNDMPSAE